MSVDTIASIPQEMVDILEKNGCQAADWSLVEVSEGFDPQRVRNVNFKGAVKLGKLSGTVTGSDGVARDSGISNAQLSNVSVGNNCVIANIGSWLSNVDIEAGVIIENVGTIACTGSSTFGNAHEVEVLNEGGGRELKITTATSAQVAYLTVMYRDKALLIDKLNAIADRHAQNMERDRCLIGEGAQIQNCGELINVWIGAAASVNGAQSLKDGTVDSSGSVPTTVGNGVIAEDFIMQRGSSVTDGVMLSGSMVGEGSRLGKQFSSENSVFFCNSEGYHSEAVALFGGPYSVTHHRSTLLIAAMVSFYNAGSGTNQSNHMYKLGPLHQGIMERGSKTGSSSYLLWPGKIGPFTAVIGKHYTNFDTSDLPFSYITDEGGKSTIVPGMNFFTVGTLRDGEKWPSRDRRKHDDKLDLIHFQVLSPFTAQKMIRGQEIMLDLHKNSEKGQEYVTYQGIRMKRLLLKTCGRYYRMALEKFMGDVIVNRLQKNTPSDLKAFFAPESDGADGSSEWIDVCGMLAAKPRLAEVVEKVEKGEIDDFAKLQAAFAAIHAAYEKDEWNYLLTTYKNIYGTALADQSAEEIVTFLENWKKSSIKLLNMVSSDASKEFEGDVKIGFGIDGNGDADFDAVRGTFEGNKFVKKLMSDIDDVNLKFDTVVKLLK